MSNRDNFATGFLAGAVVGGVVGGLLGVILTKKSEEKSLLEEETRLEANRSEVKGIKEKRRQLKKEDVNARRIIETEIAQVNEQIDDVRLQQRGSVNGNPQAFEFDRSMAEDV
mgnify:CR=1 FL=1